MTLDYFYGEQADQFTFYRIPKALFTEERFKSISAESRIKSREIHDSGTVKITNPESRKSQSKLK